MQTKPLSIIDSPDWEWKAGLMSELKVTMIKGQQTAPISDVFSSVPHKTISTQQIFIENLLHDKPNSILLLLILVLMFW